MKLGFKKNAAKGTLHAADLFAQCERLFAASFHLAREDEGGCADYILTLRPPRGRDAYELCILGDPDRSYGLFPEGKYAGHGSFIEPDGGFLRHGRITVADAARILATYTPASAG
jgi:hypothetical protein